MFLLISTIFCSNHLNFFCSLFKLFYVHLHYFNGLFDINSSNEQKKIVQICMKQTRLNYWLFELLHVVPRAVVSSNEKKINEQKFKRR